MKVQTHIKAGVTAEEVVQSAQDSVSSAAQAVGDAVKGVGQGASDLSQNLGLSELGTKLWYWPFNPPSNPAA